jgi:hypothetical protein
MYSSSSSGNDESRCIVLRMRDFGSGLLKRLENERFHSSSELASDWVSLRPGFVLHANI